MLTEKQQVFLESKLNRITLLYGSVRSGKSYISTLKWALEVAKAPENSTHIIIGRSLTTVKRNVLTILTEQVGEKNFSFSISQKQGKLFGRTIYIEGANDARAESKIRGLTLTTALIDELTLIPKDFYSMLLSRLSMPNAKLIATTNTDSPNHWVYRDIIKNDKIDKLDIKFLIDENTFLDPEYVENIKKEYSGVFFSRFILSEWVIAEGLIYPMHTEAISETKERAYSRFIISMDYGTHNATAMCLWGYFEGVWYCVKEYYYSGRTSKEPKTDDEYYTDLLSFSEGMIIEKIIIDPSAASFIQLIRKKGKYHVKPAENSVVSGISQTANAMKLGIIKINDCCKNGIKEMQSYSWDEKSNEDKPIKIDDHFVDAMRYFVYTEIYKKNGLILL